MSTFEDKFLGKHKITQPKRENVNAIYGDLRSGNRRQWQPTLSKKPRNWFLQFEKNSHEVKLKNAEKLCYRFSVVAEAQSLRRIADILVQERVH